MSNTMYVKKESVKGINQTNQLFIKGSLYIKTYKTTIHKLNQLKGLIFLNYYKKKIVSYLSCKKIYYEKCSLNKQGNIY